MSISLPCIYAYHYYFYYFLELSFVPNIYIHTREEERGEWYPPTRSAR